MPTSVRSCFDAVGLIVDGPVNYGDRVPDSRPGVYVVTHDRDPDAADPTFRYEAHISSKAIAHWILRVPKMRVCIDGCMVPPSPRDVKKRLVEFWLPHESILYIGKAGTASPSRRGIDERAGALYRHKLGNPSPHRGGHWLKTLADLEDKFILWAPVVDGRAPECVEHAMIAHFVSGVTHEVRLTLRDSDHPFPWANLEHSKRSRKKHGLRHQTRSRAEPCVLPSAG